MNKITPKILSLVVLLVNVILLIITIIQSSEEKIISYAGSGLARTLFFISVILSVVALVYTILGKKKGQAVNLPIAIINIVLAILIIIIPSIAIGMIYSNYSSLFGL